MEDKIKNIRRAIEWKVDVENDLNYYLELLSNSENDNCKNDNGENYYTRKVDELKFRLSVINTYIESRIK